MKLGKFIIPALLVFGLAGGLAVAQGGEQRVERASAMSSYTGDPDIDVGLNVQKTKNGSWAIGQFFINSFESTDVSGGDYLAFRMRSNNGGASYFDIIPNVGGNANRVPIAPDPAATGIRFIPAVPGGEAFDYGGARTWDLPLNFWADADVWFCIPKTTFSRTYFGSGTIDWSAGLWAVYFMFYGEPAGDNVNFDIGDLWTANIDENGHLVKVNRIINWASIDGNATIDTGDGSMSKLALSRNNQNLKSAVNFIRAIESVDGCSVSACETAYAANKDAYEAMNDAGLDYLEDALIGDYANGDTSHAGGRNSSYTAIAKWGRICKLAGHPLTNEAPLFFENKKENNVAIYAAIAAGLLTLAGLSFVLFKKRLVK